MQQQRRNIIINYLIASLLIIFCNSLPSKAYSLLTHEAIIDASWKSSIEPLLLLRYPGSDEKQLITAHAYAYGGAIMPDIGYSPFGSMLYTDLVHNVRTGDYILALLEESQNINEYAFALGSLAHYAGDIYGHSLGTNVAVPLMYAKLRARYGNSVTYADHHRSHSRVELSFDVLQTARGNYATKAYHDFIGFKVSRSVMERAFYKTYGLNLGDVFRSVPLAISTYRWVIKSLLPNIVRTAWASKKTDLKKANPGVTGQSFSFRMKNSTYYHEYGRDLQKAGLFPTIASLIIPVLPKLGPLAKLNFKAPNAEVENLFMSSFDSALVNFDSSLRSLHSGELPLVNKALDTGERTFPGKYAITDRCYAVLLLRLHKGEFQHINAGIKRDFDAFYSQATPQLNSRKEVRNWARITGALDGLGQAAVK